MQDAHHALPDSLAAALKRAADPGDPRGDQVPFVNKARLRAGVEEHRRTGRVSGELALMLDAIARGVWRKVRPTDSENDFAADCYLHLAGGAPLRRVDPADPRALGFLIRCAHSYASKQRQKEAVALDRRQRLELAAEAVLRPRVRRAAAQRAKYDALHELRDGPSAD